MPTELPICSQSRVDHPAEDSSADFAAAFSVFTHLLPSESYLYLEEMRRVLKPGGTFVFTFLELADDHHWAPFMQEVEVRRSGGRGHLNMPLDRGSIELWSRKLAYERLEIIPGTEAPWGQRAHMAGNCSRSKAEPLITSP